MPASSAWWNERMVTPVTQYATTADGLSIAFQDLGGSGPNLVWVTGTASHVELLWDLPGWAHTMRRLSSFARVVWFDKRGAGLSDRTLGLGSLEERMEDIRAVMDAAGMRSATIVGLSESGPICSVFAATFPERVERLVLVGTFAHNPAITATASAFEDSWGRGRLLRLIWARGMEDEELLGRIERAMGTPKSMGALIRANGCIDVRPVLPLVAVPALVVHCTADPIVSIDHGREVASLLPNAELVEIGGAFHASARPADMNLWADAIERFVMGSGHRSSVAADRVLATVLFTDIVGSTDRAAAVGDARWSQLLDEHDRICERAVTEARGRIIKATGDGVLACFDGPATAIAAAHKLVDSLRVIDVHVRVGVHTGEVERRGSDIGGIGVNLAARVMRAAAADEVWVSPTVPGLTIGAPIAFESKGSWVLDGIPGKWELYAARRTQA
jgi:class 3 adenylate cyclase